MHNFHKRALLYFLKMNFSSLVLIYDELNNLTFEINLESGDGFAIALNGD